MKRILPLIVLVAVAAALLAGCSAGAYYWQAFNGQMEVRRLSRPLDQVIAEPGISSDIRSRLEYARTARDFASAELHLPDNRSYRLYADLKRNYVVWNVFAAPALSLSLETQCFPIAGCVGYRGYFSEAAADAYAAQLRARGLDVYTGGVPAYSTLGWFDDPLLNTFMRYPELEIARLIFHELGHQVVYVKDDSTFNESFATTVEEEGLKRWMAGHATAEQKTRYAAFDQRRAQVMALFASTREKLATLYADPGPKEQGLAAKGAIFDNMRAEYARIKSGWGDYSGYDGFVLKDLNNAKLGSIATYTKQVPAFKALLERENGDLARFYAAVKDLAALPREERDLRLTELAGPAAAQ
jgi:predicted aminopeptidase